MCLTVDMELTREVRELLEQQGKVVVYKRPQLLPSANPERRSVRSEMQRDFVWREGWNRAAGDHGIRRLAPRRLGMARWISGDHQVADAGEIETVLQPSEGQSLGRGVLHAWLHKPQEDDEYLMGLEGHAEHFVAAGVIGARHVHVAFTELYLPMAELERVSKLEIPTSVLPDAAVAAAIGGLGGLYQQQVAAAQLVPGPGAVLGRSPFLASFGSLGGV